LFSDLQSQIYKKENANGNLPLAFEKLRSKQNVSDFHSFLAVPPSCAWWNL